MPDPTNAQRQRDWYARQKAGIPWQPLTCQACGGNTRGVYFFTSRPVLSGAPLCSRCWLRLTPEGRASEAERVRRSRARKRASTNPPAGAA